MSKMRKFIIVVLSVIMVTCLTLVGCKDEDRFVDFEDTTIEVNFGDQFSVAPYLQVYDVDGRFWPATAVIRDSQGNNVNHIWNIFIIEDTSYTITITIKDGDETIGERVLTLKSEDNAPPYINNPLTNMPAFGVMNMPVNIPLDFVDYSTDFNYKVEYQKYIILKDSSGLYVTSLTNKKTATNTTEGASFITNTPGDYKITVTAWDAGESEETGRVLTFDYPIKEKADSSGDIESFDAPSSAKGNYYYNGALYIGYDGVDGSSATSKYEEINLDTKVNYGVFYYLTDDSGNYIDNEGNVIYTKVVETSRIAFYNTNDELAYYQDKQTGVWYDANGVVSKYKQGACPYMLDDEGDIVYTTTKYMPINNAGVIEYWTYTEDSITHVKTPSTKVYYKDATGYKAVSSSSVPGNNVVSATMPYVGKYPDGNVSETMEIDQEGYLIKKVYSLRTITNLGLIKKVDASEDWVQEKPDANGTTKYGVAKVSSGEFIYSTSQASVYLSSTTKTVEFYNNYTAKEGESYATWMRNPSFDYISIWVMFETEDPTLETVSCYVHGTTYSSSNRMVVPVNTWYEIKISKFEWRKLNYYPYYTFGSNRNNNPNAVIYLNKSDAEKVNIFVDNIAYVKGADLKFDMANSVYAYGQEVNVDIENCGNFTKEDFIFAYADVRQFTTTSAANDKMLTILEAGKYSFTPDFDMSLGYRDIFVYAYLKHDKFVENGYNQIYATAIITVNNFNIEMTQETEGDLLINNETTVVTELENSDNLEVVVEFEDGTPIALTNGKFTPTQIGYYTVKASATYFGTEVYYEKSFAVLGLVEVTVNAVDSTFVDVEDVVVSATADGITSFEYKVVTSLGNLETLASNTFRPYYSGTYTIRAYAKNAGGEVVGLGEKTLLVKEPNVLATGIVEGFNSAKSVIAAYKRTATDASNATVAPGNYKYVYEGADSVAPNTTWLAEFEGKKGVIKTKPQEAMAGAAGANGIYLRSSVWRSSSDYKGLLYDSDSMNETTIYQLSSNDKWDYVGFMIYLPKENAAPGETHKVADYYGFNAIEVPYNTWFEFKFDKLFFTMYFSYNGRPAYAFTSSSTSSSNGLQSCLLLSDANQEIYIDYIKVCKYNENEFSSFDITLADGDSAGTSILGATQVDVNGATKFKLTATIDATDDGISNPTEIDYSKLEIVWFNVNGTNVPNKIGSAYPYGKKFNECYTVTNNNEFTFKANTSTSKAMGWLVKYVDETSGKEYYKHVCGYYKTA